MREAEAFLRFMAAFKGFLLFPFAHLFDHTLGVVKFYDVALPLFRKIVRLTFPLLPMLVGELLRGAEAVKLGRLLEGQVVGFLRLAVRQTFFQIFELWIVAPIAKKELLPFFEFLAKSAVTVGQALRRIGLHVLQYLELIENFSERQVRCFLAAALVVVWHRAYYLVIR